MDKKLNQINQIDNIIHKALVYENFSKLSLNKQTLLIEQRLHEQWYADAWDSNKIKESMGVPNLTAIGTATVKKRSSFDAPKVAATSKDWVLTALKEF